MVNKSNSHLSVLYSKFEGWSIKPAQFLIPLLMLATLMNGYLFVKNPNIGSDALYYRSAFHNVITGKGLTNYYRDDWAPGYGLLSYLFFLLFRDIELSGMLVSALAYLLMIPTAFFTVNFLFGTRSAYLASFLITFWPTLISYSYVSLTDTVFTFFLFVGFTLFTRLLLGKNTTLSSALLGLTLGFAYLIRVPEALWVAFLVILCLLVMGIANLKHEERKQLSFASLAKPFSEPIIVFLCFLIFALPYVTLIHARTRIWSFTNRLDMNTEVTQVVSGTTTPQGVPSANATQVESSILPTQVTSNNNTTQLPHSVSTTPVLSNTKTMQWARRIDTILEYLFLRPIASYAPRFTNILKNGNILTMNLVGMNIHALAPLALLGILMPFLSIRKLFTQPRPDSRKLRLVLSFGIFLSPVLLLLSVTSRLDNRYLMPYSIYILIASAFFIVSFLERLLVSFGVKSSDIWVILLGLFSVAISAGFGSPTLPEVMRSRHAHLGLRAAGLWLQGNVRDPNDLSIISPKKSAIALFYASGQDFSIGSSRDFYPSDMSLEAIGDLVNADEIDYLLLDNFYAYALPHMKSLWNDPEMAQEYGLSLLHQDSNDLFQIYSRSSIGP